MAIPRVLYKDQSVVLIDKPSGLAVHSTGRTDERTLVDWLLENFPEVKTIGEDPMRPGIVHRIDRETSGIMVVARTSVAFARLKKQFARHEVQKTYRAFVYGDVKEERGIIDRAIGRARGNGSRRSVRDPHGTSREAQTLFRRIGHTKEASYLNVFPKTGRTHQIRVHLASINHAVVCDKLYAPNRPVLLGFSRLALHALSLSFLHPETKKQVSFESPLPQDFIEAEKELREV